MTVMESPSPQNGQPWLQISLAIISLIGVIVTAYLAYLASSNAKQTQVDVKSTQAAASNLPVVTLGGKFCFFSSDTWHYTMPVPQTWIRADCEKLSKTLNAKNPHQIGCLYPRGYSLVSASQTPDPDCGWDPH